MWLSVTKREDGQTDEIYKMSGYCPQIDIGNTDGDNIYFYTDSYKDGNPEEVENNYYVYNISFTKTNPEGLFFIYGDDEQWHRISSFSFEEVWPGP